MAKLRDKLYNRVIEGDLTLEENEKKQVTTEIEKAEINLNQITEKENESFAVICEDDAGKLFPIETEGEEGNVLGVNRDGEPEFIQISPTQVEYIVITDDDLDDGTYVKTLNLKENQIYQLDISDASYPDYPLELKSSIFKAYLDGLSAIDTFVGIYDQPADRSVLFGSLVSVAQFIVISGILFVVHAEA